MICILLQLKVHAFLCKNSLLTCHSALFPPLNIQINNILSEDGTVITSTFEKGSAIQIVLPQCWSPISPSQMQPYTILHPQLLNNPNTQSNLRTNSGSHTLERSSETPTPTPHVGQKLLNPLPIPAPRPNRFRILPFNLPDPNGPRRPHPTSYFRATWTQGPDWPADKDQNVHSARCACALRGRVSAPRSLRDAARTVSVARPRLVFDYLLSAARPLFRLWTTFPLRLCWSALCPTRTWLPFPVIMGLAGWVVPLWKKSVQAWWEVWSKESAFEAPRAQYQTGQTHALRYEDTILHVSCLALDYVSRSPKRPTLRFSWRRGEIVSSAGTRTRPKGGRRWGVWESGAGTGRVQSLWSVRAGGSGLRMPDWEWIFVAAWPRVGDCECVVVAACLQDVSLFVFGQPCVILCVGVWGFCDCGKDNCLCPCCVCGTVCLVLRGGVSVVVTVRQVRASVGLWLYVSKVGVWFWLHDIVATCGSLCNCVSVCNCVKVWWHCVCVSLLCPLECVCETVAECGAVCLSVMCLCLCECGCLQSEFSVMTSWCWWAGVPVIMCIPQGVCDCVGHLWVLVWASCDYMRVTVSRCLVDCVTVYVFLVSVRLWLCIRAWSCLWVCGCVLAYFKSGCVLVWHHLCSTKCAGMRCL